MTVNIIGPLSGGTKIRDGNGIINTTSSSINWSQGLSPFLLGPIPLYNGAPCKYALRFENCWQYSKVYKEFDVGNFPSSFYFDWAKKGFENNVPKRYPMGKGAIPKYSYWGGDCLNYIEARKRIYIPLYRDAVYKTEAFQILKKIYNDKKQISLWCYDGYNHRDFDMSYDDVINNDKLKMGHSFVLAMMLEGYL